MDEVNAVAVEPRILALNAQNNLSVFFNDQEGQLFFELIGNLEEFKFSRFGSKTTSVYSIIKCPACDTSINAGQTTNTISTDEQFSSLLYVPYPRGTTLDQVIKNEFLTVTDIAFNCKNANCRSANIGTKSKTVIISTCQTGIMVSVQRRDFRTQLRIPDPINLGETCFNLFEGTPNQITLSLAGSIQHIVSLLPSTFIKNYFL